MNEPLGRAFDEYLVVLSQGGSVDAFDGLARRWTPRLRRYAARMLGGSPDAARDVVQETWVGAIRGLQNLRDPAQFPAWIYGIATRKCADAIRANTHRRRIDERAADNNVAVGQGSSPSPDHQLDLATAIRALPPTHRAVVHLFYREDWKVEEIASVLGIPVGTVKSRLHNAREALKRQLTVTLPARHEANAFNRGIS